MLFSSNYFVQILIHTTPSIETLGNLPTLINSYMQKMIMYELFEIIH